MTTRVDLSSSVFCGLSPCRLAMAGETACTEVAQKMKKELHPRVLQTEMVSPMWMRRGLEASTYRLLSKFKVLPAVRHLQVKKTR